MTNKELFIKGFSHLLKHDIYAGNDLLLVTAFGTIHGTVLNSEDENSDNPSYATMAGAMNAHVEIAKKQGVEAPEFAVIPLKDVTIIGPSGQKSTFPVLSVFADQVIALSFGSAQTAN